MKGNGILRLAITASLLTAGHCGIVLAQDEDEPIELDTIETVIVTGTRRDERTVFDSIAPIDVVSGTAINNTTSEDLNDSLAQLVPSFKVQRLPLNDGLIYVRPASLRALSPDHTLVMINGKRRHRSALLGFNGAQAPDMAMIPSFAIKRVEVLRDGASAQYGSDAIAGVINVILDDRMGVGAFGQYLEYYEGDGENARVGVKGGMELGDGGFLFGALEYSDADRTSRTRQRPDAIAFQQENPDLNVPNPVQNWGQPERELLRLALNAELRLSDTAALYAFGTYADGEGLSDFNWRNPDSTSAFNPSSAFPDFDLRTIYPTGFTPQFGQDDTDTAFTGGARGLFANGLSWDVSGSYGSNEIDYKIFDTINASLGPESPTAFGPGTLSQTEINFNLDFAYEFDAAMFALPANLAFGAERREEEYEVGAGDLPSFQIGPGAADGLPSGSNGFPGYSQDQAGTFDQTSYALYADLDMPITEQFTLGLAGRYEDYSEFGDTTNGKVSARYAFTPDFALRGTLSTGFRAPTPGQLFSERTSQGLDTVTLNIFTNGRFSPEGPVADIVSQRPDADIVPLEAEESENVSVGFVYRNAAGFDLTVDFYQIDVDQRFGTSDTFTLTDEERAQLVALGVPGGEGITRVNFFQNDFDTRTRGLDAVASYRTDLGQGTLLLSAAYNYNETEVRGGALEQNDTTRRRFEELLPQHTATINADYTFGKFGLLGRLRYYGEWTDFSFNAEGDIFQEFGAETFVDLALSYNATENLTVRVGAENVFDSYPDEAEFQANRGLIYSRNAPYDTDGGLYYVRLDFGF